MEPDHRRQGECWWFDRTRSSQRRMPTIQCNQIAKNNSRLYNVAQIGHHRVSWELEICLLATNLRDVTIKDRWGLDSVLFWWRVSHRSGSVSYEFEVVNNKTVSICQFDVDLVCAQYLSPIHSQELQRKFFVPTCRVRPNSSPDPNRLRSGGV
jgi:hypothetical protein